MNIPLCGCCYVEVDGQLRRVEVCDNCAIDPVGAVIAEDAAEHAGKAPFVSNTREFMAATHKPKPDLAARCEALQQLLNDRDQKLDNLEAEKFALEDQVKGLQELMAHQDALFGSYGDTLRPFVELMRKELEANSHKGDREGWLGMTTGTAVEEVEHHLRKLRNAVAYVWQDEIKEHAADVSNCCMMLLDVMGLLIEPPSIFGMNLVVDGNMPDDEMHLVSGDGGTVKLVVNDGKARDA